MGNLRCDANNELCTPHFGGTIKTGQYIGLGFCRLHWGRAYSGSKNVYSLDFGKGKYKRESRRSHYDCSVPECNDKQMPLTGLCPKHHKSAWRYNITDADFIAFVINPHCSNSGCENITDLVMDHNHACCDKPPTCGKCNRGWLCRTCNLALGYTQDNPRKLQGLLDYLGSVLPS